MAKKKIKQNIEISPTHDLAEDIVRTLIDNKARDLICLDVTGQSSITDFIIICSGTSDTHLKTLADKVTAKLKETHSAPNAICGYPSTNWVIIDLSDLIIHLFLEETRSFYNLEQLFKNANSISLPSDLEEEVKKLRTGLF